MFRVLTIVCALVAWYGCSKQGSGNNKSPAKNQQVDSLIAVAFATQYNNLVACDSIAGVVYAMSEQQGYTRGIAEAWFLRGSSQQQAGNYDSAIALTQKALDIFNQLEDKGGIARCYNDLGINYDFKAYYSKAIEYYLRALRLFEELNDARGQANAYNNIGIIHQNQSNYKEAADNFQKARNIAQAGGYEDGVINALNSLGSNYRETGNYDSALRCFEIVLKADLEAGNKSYISYSYNNLGEAYLGLGDYDKALLYLKKSKALKEELGNRRALANTLKNMGELYLQTRDYTNAKIYLDTAAIIATELNVPEIRKAAFELLHVLNTQTGDYKTALYYYKKAEGIKNEISYDKKNAEISRLEKDFEVEKARSQLAISRGQTQSNRMLVLIYGAVIILLVVLLGAVWLVLRQKQKSNRMLLQYQQQLQATNTELEEKNNEISRQKKEVEMALAARSSFLSFMSHEVRTPLNGITGLVDLLKTQPMTPGQEEYIDALKQSADNLMLLLNNVLDLSRLETGRVDLESIAVDVRNILKNQTVLYKGSALLRNTDVEVEVDDNVPDKLLGDPYRLGQIIANLINNAIKFTRNGKITARCTLLNKTENEARLLFEVSDTGIGIAPDQLQSIMEPFAQAESHTTRKYGGTGLGLTIVNRLLNLMNTTIQVKSKVREGSVFSFELTLPLYRAPIIQDAPIPAGAAQAGLEGIKVLVVEDNTTNILLFTRLLASLHTEYDVADNGYKALEFAAQKHYDIILMDLHMPRISGYETAEKIKTGQNFNRTTPILAITAADESEVKNHPLRGFLDGVLYKPVQYSGLLQHIKQLLGK